MEKSYVLCEVSQWQNYHFILKGPLWLKKLCIKKKAEIQYVSKTTFGLSVFLFTESKQGFMHQLLSSMNKQQRVARTFWFPQHQFPQLGMFSGYANGFLE